MGAARLVGKPGTGPRRNPTSRPAPPGDSAGAIRAFLGRIRWVCHRHYRRTWVDRFRDLLLTNSVILARSVLHDVRCQCVAWAASVPGPSMVVNQPHAPVRSVRSTPTLA